MKALALLLWIPSLIFAETKVLVDTIPVDATFLGVSPVGMPFHDAETVEPKTIETGLAGAVASILESTKPNGIDFICLLSAPGENPVEIPIAAAKAKLKLSRKNTAVTSLFFRGGRIPPTPIIFSTEKLTPGKPQVSIQMQKISVPPGVTTAGWVYFNLSRIQTDALKAGSSTAVLQMNGSGKKTPVAIPGMREPLIAFDDGATLTAAWYIDAKTEALLRQQADAQQNATAKTTSVPKVSP